MSSIVIRSIQNMSKSGSLVACSDFTIGVLRHKISSPIINVGARSPRPYSVKPLIITQAARTWEELIEDVQLRWLCVEESREVDLSDVFDLRPKTYARIMAKVRYMGRAPFRGAMDETVLMDEE